MKMLMNTVLAVLGGISFGLLAPIVKLGSLHGISTVDSTRMQLFCGFFLLLIINIFFVRYRLKGKTFIKLLISGIPMGLTTTFIYKSLNYLDASIAIVLLFQYIWMGLIAEIIITRRVPTKMDISSAALVLLGSLFAVNIFEAQFESLPLMGVMWGLLAAISFASFLFVSGQVATHVPALRKSMVMALGGLLMILIIYPPVDIDLSQMNWQFIRHGLILGLFGAVLPPLLFSISMPVVGNALGTILSSSELPTTIIFSAIIVAEQITSHQVIGIVIILSAIALANIPHLRLFRVRT